MENFPFVWIATLLRTGSNFVAALQSLKKGKLSHKEKKVFIKFIFELGDYLRRTLAAGQGAVL